MFAQFFRRAASTLRRVPLATRIATGAGLMTMGSGYLQYAEAKANYDLKLQYALDKNNVPETGELDVLQVKAVLKDYYPYFDWLDICDNPSFATVFEAFDRDADGKMNKQEFEEMMCHLNGGHTGDTYNIIASPGMEDFAKKLVHADPERFTYFPTKWGKFPDLTDNIETGGYHPINRIRDESILFLASFHNNDVTLSQFHVMTMLAESFPKDLTILLPFYTTATMERVIKEGTCATGSTLARFFSNLPNSGRPHRVMVYDLHTLQGRFYLYGNALASLHTAFPLLIDKIQGTKIDCVAFPDAGAEKRFSAYFKKSLPNVELIVCGKKRDPYDPSKRTVVIKDGEAKGRNVVIVDDMVQSGGTLTECGKVLKAAGANSVNAFVTHGVFPRDSYKRFLKGGDRAIFDNFWVTNSNPTVVNKIPSDDTFEVLDITDLVIKDL